MVVSFSFWEGVFRLFVHLFPFVDCYCFIVASSSFAFSLKYFAASDPLFSQISLIVKPRSKASNIKNATLTRIKDPFATFSPTFPPAWPAAPAAPSSTTCLHAWNGLENIWDYRSFSVLKTLTGYRPYISNLISCVNLLTIFCFSMRMPINRCSI